MTEFVEIPADFLNPITFNLLLDGWLEKEAKVLLKLLQQPTKTWKHAVAFTIESTKSSDARVLQIKTDDKAYFFLDRGTSVRYATMSPGYTSKTSPGSLQSGKGSGGVVRIDKSHPKPGIQARRFVETASAQREPVYSNDFQKVINIWIKRTARK